MLPKTQRILWFKDITIKDIPRVGGKTASLGEMYSKLGKKGIAVPNGFAVTAAAYREFLETTKLRSRIDRALVDLDPSDVSALAAAGEKAREMILKSDLPSALVRDLKRAYAALSKEAGEERAGAAVRSSATAEDLPGASFAGQQETYLNVRGEDDLIAAVKKCMASLYTDRAISYRHTQGFDHRRIALSVAVQLMVRSDLGVSGVLFTLDTESGFPGVVLINAAYGLGEYVVKGRVTPDQFYIFKEGVKQGKAAVISRILGGKSAKLVYKKEGSGTKEMTVPAKDRGRFCLLDEDILTLARAGMAIEAHYGAPQDIEWAKDGRTGKLYIVQSRPETVVARADRAVIEEYRLKKNGKILLRGTAIGRKIGAGRARIIDNPKHLDEFKPGEVLVTRLTDPDWEPIMRLSTGIVTEEGGKTSHAAIVSRELGVPCIVGAASARKLIAGDKPVTVSCAEGDEGMVFEGILPFEVRRTALKDIPETKTKIMMNVGDPDNAFALSFLPCDGVGLAREEFIFTNFIRIHPLALMRYPRLKDAAAKKQIAALTRGWKTPAEYGIQKLAEGIGRIAVAFYPRPVVARLSDFKTNEYATLIGGKEFEPTEENPMLGWRGASRYYSEDYRDGFRLECEAMKRVRNEWGLSNVIVMIPFCRTPEEGEKALAAMKKNGLARGENGLKVYTMCEIPSNVVLASAFAEIFDGFSIGSNDLTQLTLGVDRDSARVSHVYDERSSAVKALIREVISAAHRARLPIGICGQAPSDYPEFAEFLVREGIDSISLNPDTVVSVRRRIAAVEKTIGRASRKPHMRTLSALALFGILMSGLLSFGAGCDNLGLGAASTDPTLADWSPAELRERLVARAKADAEARISARDAESAKQTATLQVSAFSRFRLQYPASWTVEHWSGGVTLHAPTGAEYVSIFPRTVRSQRSAPSFATSSLTVGGRAAVLYSLSFPDGGATTTVQVAEIPSTGGPVVEANGNGANFTSIVSSLVFGGAPAPTSTSSTAAALAETACPPAIAYARQYYWSECQPFQNACAVPAGWRVCR